MEVVTNLYRVYNRNICFEVKTLFVPVAKQSIFENGLFECVLSIYKSKLTTDRRIVHYDVNNETLDGGFK